MPHDSHSHLSASQNVLDLPHLGKGPLASGVQEHVITNMVLLVGREGRKAIIHGDSNIRCMGEMKVELLGLFV